MKRIRMTFTVEVDDEPELMSGDKVPLEEITTDLFQHIALWDGNVYGTVEVESENIEDA